MRIYFNFLFFLILLSGTAQAQQLESNFEDWTVYTVKQQNKKICYMASVPTKETGNFTKRSDPYVLITNINNKVDEVSTSSGYPYKIGEDVTAQVDGKSYKLFTKGELAWAYDITQD